VNATSTDITKVAIESATAVRSRPSTESTRADLVKDLAKKVVARLKRLKRAKVRAKKARRLRLVNALVNAVVRAKKARRLAMSGNGAVALAAVYAHTHTTCAATTNSLTNQPTNQPI
jgi:hypothetical protein